jgi:hypothetical protein
MPLKVRDAIKLIESDGWRLAARGEVIAIPPSVKTKPGS